MTRSHDVDGTSNGERLPTGKLSNVFGGTHEGPFWPEGPPPLVVRNRVSHFYGHLPDTVEGRERILPREERYLFINIESRDVESERSNEYRHFFCQTILFILRERIDSILLSNIHEKRLGAR
jgi:hypothetical protein